LSASVRSAMGQAAVAAARAVGYRNAGTCEFLLEGEGDTARFYFLEMNTRLQVEHPVTECVVGVDLVHAQLAVAGGEPLPFTQEGLSQRGHAIECRIYAEDPAQGFIPQAGQLLLYREPQGPGIRVDSGVTTGTVVSVYYDPMLAKLIVWGESRDIARHRALAALREFAVLGIRTNIPFMQQLLQHPQFVAATIDTGFLDREGAAIAAASITELPAAAHAAVAEHRRLYGSGGGPAPLAGLATPGGGDVDPFVSLRGWRG
jgi:acetyl/propionyl-CoA carboxylase alpha subunit